MRWLVMLASAVALVTGCGGGGGGSSFQPGDASPSGIWEGVLTFEGSDSTEVLGLIAETGEALFMTDDGLMMWGSAASVDGNQFTADFQWALPPLVVTPDNASGGTGTITCTFDERVSIDCDLTARSTAGEDFPGSLGASYDNIYEEDSSYAVVAGDWLDVVSGSELLSIDGSGNMFSQDSMTGCVLSGKIVPINPAYNAYRINLTLDACTDPDLAPANGTRFDGMGAVGNDLRPMDTLLFGVHGAFLGVPIPVMAIYTRI